MKFCPECKSLMLPKKGDDGKSVYNCECGYSEVGDATVITSKTKSVEIKKLETPKEDADERLPKCKMECEECKNPECYYWEIQTRASDEPPTRFYKCVKCKHTWREYN